MIKVGRGKDVGQLPQDRLHVSAGHNVVVYRDGDRYDVRRMVNERADLLVCNNVPE